MARAKLGQHFLKSTEVLDRVASRANALPGSLVVEIGTGPGNLTQRLEGDRIVSVELDEEWAERAERQFRSQTRVQIVQGDILSLKLEAWAQGPRSLKVVGSLPYHITHEIVTKMIEEREWIASFLWIVQKEVAARLSSLPGARSSSRISVQWSRWFTSVLCGDIPASCFNPPPRVVSTILSGERRDAPLFEVGDEGIFTDLVRILFRHRRKTVYNGLRLAGMPETDARSLLTEASIPESCRPEQLTAANWERLSCSYVLREKNSL